MPWVFSDDGTCHERPSVVNWEALEFVSASLQLLGVEIREVPGGKDGSWFQRNKGLSIKN